MVKKTKNELLTDIENLEREVECLERCNEALEAKLQSCGTKDEIEKLVGQIQEKNGKLICLQTQLNTSEETIQHLKKGKDSALCIIRSFLQVGFAVDEYQPIDGCDVPDPEFDAGQLRAVRLLRHLHKVLCQ